MRRQRGATLAEVLTGLGIMSLVLVASANLLLAGVRSFERSNLQAELHSKNAQGIRRVAQGIREAMAVNVSPDGTQITYYLPQYNAAPDGTTGERELREPLTSDGVARTFTVDFVNGTLKSGDGKVLVRNVLRTDPNSKSTQYNMQYAPFQLTTIGSVRAVTINLITRMSGRTGTNDMRMKTTVILRNSAG